MSDRNAVTVERDVRLSESQLWEAQRSYYHEQGVDAWADAVPFYITSNPFIANSYSTIVVQFMRDWLQAHPELRSEPFYFVELGTGSGQFSFYMIKRLKELCEALSLSDVKLRYVMTDFTENNVAYWREHSALAPFVRDGILDFAVFDLENDKTMTLTESGVTLAENTVKNPMIVFANYLFDSVKTDAFALKDGCLQEAKLVVSASPANIENGKILSWEKASINYESQDISSNYYVDPVIDRTLMSYQNEDLDTHFLFPIGGLNGLRNLKAMSHDRLFMVTSDKGYTTLDELDDCDPPGLDFHGSFSLMVNYDAMGRYFREIGGNSYMQAPRDGLASAVFSCGVPMDEFVETRHAIDEYINHFTPTDYYNFYENLNETSDDSNLAALVSFLAFSRWDPYIYDEINERVEELMDDASDELVEYLADNIPKLADNFYYVPKVNDIYFDFGVYMQEVERFEQAIEYFEKSLEYFGESCPTLYNLGLCEHYSDRDVQAYEYLKRAQAVDPKDRDVREWVKKLSKMNTVAA